jgi:flagellin
VGSITINSNIAALNAQRRLGQSTRSLQDSFTRLSSGLRINKASDDAAGLSIAESLKTDRRVFNQGVRNLNDGISLLSIADGAVAELTNVVTRLAELAEQAANGSLSNTQRGALDEEAQALKDEYLRVAQTTEFNGQKLFDGKFGDLRLQAGFGENGGIVSGLGGAIGTGEFTAGTTFAVGNGPKSLSMGDFNGDGVLDVVTANANDSSATVLLGTGDGSFSAATSFALSGGPQAVSTGDFNGDGVLDLVMTIPGNGTASVLLGAGDGNFSAAISFVVGAFPSSVSTGDFNGDGVLDLVTGNYVGDTASILLGSSTDGVSPLLEFSLRTQADARQALPVFKQKLDQLASQRGQIGAFEARISTAVATTQVASENYASAESQIADADVAIEAAQLVRNQILQQAGAAILAQANQAPALALALLG